MTIDHPNHVCLIIPCYNEAKRLATESFLHFLNNTTYVNLLFVNDGSTDQTLETLQHICATHENAALLDLRTNVGKAEAVRLAILHALTLPYEYVGYFDADLSTSLQESERMYQLLETEKELAYVMGSRIAKLGNTIVRDKLRHYLGRGVATFIDSFHLQLNTYDTQCGAKLMRTSLAKEVFQTPFVSRWLFDVEILSRIVGTFGRERTRKIVFEMPLKSWYHHKGSKINFQDLFRIPLDFLKIKKAYQLKNM